MAKQIVIIDPTDLEALADLSDLGDLVIDLTDEQKQALLSLDNQISSMLLETEDFVRMALVTVEQTEAKVDAMMEDPANENMLPILLKKYHLVLALSDQLDQLEEVLRIQFPHILAEQVELTGPWTK